MGEYAEGGCLPHPVRDVDDILRKLGVDPDDDDA